MSSGISRRVNASSQHDDILVFGYACKLFRDDSKALFVDQGGTLIPWMGDKNQPIDRYDGRATIHNLSPFEAPKQELEPNDYLTTEEIAIEDMCQIERYRSLELEEDYVDPEKEEGKEGAAIHFNYDQENANSISGTALAPTVFVQDEPEPPSLKTLANVLEKTTEFIAKNGAQMEILMRAKEAGNLKFQFLNPDNPYHPIYKQVLEKKRQRNKNPYLFSEKACNQGELSIEDVEASLRRLTRNLPSAAPNPTTPDGTSSPSYGNGGGSAYSRLVEKIREKKAEAAAKDAAKNTMSSAGPSENSTPVPSPSPSASAEETGLSENSNHKIDQTEGTEEQESVIEVIPPPLDIQILIDKTASWVCKENLKSENKQSGEERLSIVKKLHKDKFDFLFTGNKYHNYYLFKIALYTEMLSSQTKTILQDTSQTLADKPELTDNLSLKITSESNDCRQLSESSGKSFPTLKGFFN